jgi:hypothetical protein
MPSGALGLPILRKIAAVLSWSGAHSSLSPAYAEQHRPETGTGKWVSSLFAGGRGL